MLDIPVTPQRASASGGGHERRARVSKSEPIPATARSFETRHSGQPRNVGSTSRGASGGSGEKLYTNREPSDSRWPVRDTTQSARGDANGAGSGRFAGPDRDRPVGGEWTSRENPDHLSPEMPGGGGNSTIHSLLKNGGGSAAAAAAAAAARHGVAYRQAGPRASGDGSDELGGESTFLAAHPMDSGLGSSRGEGLGLLVGRGTTEHL